jgi:surface carbohydrate biosynthesis protein
MRVFSRISFEKLPQCEVLQFSGTTSALQTLGSHIKLVSMPSIGERILLSIVVRSILRGRFTRWGYYRTFVESAGAKLILVWNDTNVEAYQLQYRVSVPVWSIQNGIRHDVAPSQSIGFLTGLRMSSISRRPEVTKYFTFGDSSTALLSREVGAEFVQTGSVRLNGYLAHRNQRKLARDQSQQRIGFIVSFPNGSDIPGGTAWDNQATFVRVNGQSVSYHDYFSVDALVALALSRVAESRAMHFSIIGKRSSIDSVERDFFFQAPSCRDIDVIAHEKGSGYEVADTYDYLFTVDSTLGYEMLAAGKKVGFISNRFRTIGVDTFEMTFGYPLTIPMDGDCWTSATDQKQIELFAERFLDLSEDAWNTIHREIAPRMMVTDPGNQTLLAMLADELSHR